MNRFLSGGRQRRRPPVARDPRRGSRRRARRSRSDAKDLLDTTPGIADARLGRDDGRPELAVRVDRPKAALLGLTATSVANTIRTNVAGTQAALFREAGNEYPIIVRLREDERQQVADVDDVLVSTPQGQVLPAKNLMRDRQRSRAGRRSSARTSSASPTSAPSRRSRSARRSTAVAGAAAAAAHDAARTSASASAPRSSSRPRRSTSCGWC